MMNSQIAVNALMEMISSYEISNCRIHADSRVKNPAALTITLALKDGSVMCISKDSLLEPFITEEQYGELVLQKGREMISNISPIIAVRH